MRKYYELSIDIYLYDMKTIKNILKTLLAAIITVVVAIALGAGLAFLLGIVTLVFWAAIGAVTVEEEEEDEDEDEDEDNDDFNDMIIYRNNFQN